MQVTALVTQPERIASNISNTFEFIFEVTLAQHHEGGRQVLKRVLPSTEEQAMQLLAHFPGLDQT